MLVEKDLVARTMLHRKFPGPLIVADFDDGDWRHWKRNKTAVLGIKKLNKNNLLPCPSQRARGDGKRRHSVY